MTTHHYPVAREVTTLVCDGRSLPDIQSIYERTFKVEGFSAKWLYCFDPFRGPEYYFVCSWPNRDGKYGAWHMRFLLCDFDRSLHNLERQVMNHFKYCYDTSRDGYKMHAIDKLPDYEQL